MGSGWSAAAAVTVRVGLAALLLTVPALLQLRGRWALLRRSAGAVISYGVFAIGAAQLFFFNAVEHLSVGVALLLEYSGTLLVVAWVWLRHGQRPRRLTVIGGAVAIAGLMLVLDIIGNAHIDPLGVLWGLGAATGLAVYFVLSSKTHDQLPPIVLAWAGLSMGTVILLATGATGIVPMHASTADTQLAGHRTSWLVPVIGLSLVAAVIAYSAGIAAARLLGARLASFVGLAEVLAAVLFAWALLGQRPTAVQMLGGLVVLVGIALVHADEKDAPARAARPELEPAL
jgi:drug/metabolite transporter (DMT)-like permease